MAPDRSAGAVVSEWGLAIRDSGNRPDQTLSVGPGEQGAGRPEAVEDDEERLAGREGVTTQLSSAGRVHRITTCTTPRPRLFKTVHFSPLFIAMHFGKCVHS